MRTINVLWFIYYKFFNSLFLGVSVGAIFTLYAPLKPSVYAVGGVLLAVATLGVARLYHTILQVDWFFKISLFVEVVLLMAMCYFLYASYGYQSALLLYIGYQVTFTFGNYLIRAETLLLHTDELLTKLDTAKQLGYLLGMGLSYIFYKLLVFYGTENAQRQVYLLHYLLIGIEVLVIVLILKSFKKN